MRGEPDEEQPRNSRMAVRCQVLVHRLESKLSQWSYEVEAEGLGWPYGLQGSTRG